MLNPAPAADMDPALLAVTDWLIPNEHEFARIAGATPDVTDAEIVRFAGSAGTRVVVTLGARGAALLDTDGVVRRIPAPNVTAVDTTGAGDAFVGGFAFGLATGLDDVAAVTLGVRCASDSVQRPGTQRSFPDGERARAFLQLA